MFGKFMDKEQYRTEQTRIWQNLITFHTYFLGYAKWCRTCQNYINGISGRLNK